MPALRAHLTFSSVVRDALPAALPAAGDVVAAHWAATLIGALAPDVWYIVGGRRVDLHGLDKEDPATWSGAIGRWRDAHPEFGPGRTLPPETAAFVAGYLIHLGLDTWAQYQETALPEAVRRASPPAWFPLSLAAAPRLRAALQRLAEAPFPAERRLVASDVDQVTLPAGVDEVALKRMTACLLSSLALEDPWAMSRIHPWREMPVTEAAYQEWAQRRATLSPATAGEYADLLRAASAFTIAALSDWW
jgi:hypothetical protein